MQVYYQVEYTMTNGGIGVSQYFTRFDKATQSLYRYYARSCVKAARILHGNINSMTQLQSCIDKY